jgi:fermentation-respiration switch protein FrsA (DUF1100 family)
MKVAFALIALVAVIAFLVRMVESRFAFFPVAGETVTPNDFGIPHEPLRIDTADGEQLRAWAIGSVAGSPAEAGHYLPSLPRAHIVYFHGNGGNLSIWAPILARIAREGYSVLAFDYRGYGTSTGYPNERALYRDVDAVVKRFWEGPRQDIPVVYWGRSLGAAMAAYAATVHPPDGLILESAFPDARTLMRSSPLMAFLFLFSTYRFPAAEFMQHVSAPVLMMHGDRDSVIPFVQGQTLFEKVPGPKRFFTIRGGDHNDAAPRDPRTYWEAVGELVAQARPQ